MSVFQRPKPERPRRWKILTPALSSTLQRSLAIALAVMASSVCGQLAQAEAPCRTIQFQAGASSITISGSVDPDATQCFHFSTRQGQNVRVAITSKDQNTVFSILGLVDARDQYTFKSQKQTYEIVVGQLMRSATADTYQLMLSIK